MNSFFFYKHKNILQNNIVIPDGMIIKKVFPHAHVAGMKYMGIGYKRLLYFSFYFFFSKVKRRIFIEYDLMCNGKVLSKVVCISKNPIYEFLPTDGVHICYCETIPEERGKGYFPLLIQYALYQNHNTEMYMIVAADNISSIKGIEKAGFVRYAYGKKNNNHFITTEFIEP